MHQCTIDFIRLQMIGAFAAVCLPFSPARFCDRVMAGPSRTVADKHIMVSSLEQAIDATLDHFGSRNIDEYLDKGGDQTQWRATPNGKHMSSLAFMVDQFIGTGGCTNGVIPTKNCSKHSKPEMQLKRLISPIAACQSSVPHEA